MKYSLFFVTVLVISTFLLVDAKKKPNKYEGDFEFVDEVNDDTFEEWILINILLARN